MEVNTNRTRTTVRRSLHNLTHNMNGKEMEEVAIEERLLLIDEVITLQNEATFGVFNTLFLGDMKELA